MLGNYWMSPMYRENKQIITLVSKKIWKSFAELFAMM